MACASSCRSGTAKVVLAASTIETTRLALVSFPTPLMGRNLMAHIRSDFTVRVRRSALPTVPGHVQTGALLLRGRAAGAPFHLQLTASTSRAGSDAMLYQMVPDLDLLDQQLVNTDPDWITITLRGIGAMTGDRTTPVPSAGTSWINLSPYEQDEYGIARAYVNLRTSAADNTLWTAMDQTASTSCSGSPLRQEILSISMTAGGSRRRSRSCELFRPGIGDSARRTTRPARCGWAATR